MEHWLVGAFTGVLCGIGIAFLNYAIASTVLRRKPQIYPTVSVARQGINVLFLLGLYFLAPLTPWGEIELLTGGAIGITIPMFFLTAKLVRQNDSIRTPPPPGSQESAPTLPPDSAGGTDTDRKGDD